MLNKAGKSRTLSDDIMLGIITAFSAGMVNVASLIIFFSFTSNVTGHYAVLAQEIAQGNWFQAATVFGWISLFFLGNFVSNLCFVNKSRSKYLSHTLPLIFEIACLMFVGMYLQYFYTDSLWETELLVATMLFAMGLQNGLTASISSMSLKTTHLTGLTTDLAISFSMLTKSEHREDPAIVNKTKLLLAVLLSYMGGGILAGVAFLELQNSVFYVVSAVLAMIIVYDILKITAFRIIIRSQPFIRKSYFEKEI